MHDEYVKQLDFILTKRFLINWRQDFIVSHFIPVDTKKQFNKMVLNVGWVFFIVQIKQTIIGETETAPQKKKMRRNQ